LALFVRLGVAELDLHQEAVELRLGQRERADLMRGVARRDNEERRGQRVRRAVGRDLSLLHRLEQRALRLRRRAVDFVREHQLREDRSLVELEASAIAVEHGHAEHVRGQQVARELDALVAQAERACECVR